MSRSKFFLNALLATPAVAGIALSSVASAETPTASLSSLDQLNRYGLEGQGRPEVDQVTSVSQLSDVRPTDWAFQALQSLVERYGCIAGYPSGVYLGNRAMTRYEFAAGLNACLERVNELIAASTAPLASKADLEVLSRLQEEFGSELATLRGRVDSLEGRIAFIEKNQFSTTTKLTGEVIFSLAAASSGNDSIFGDDSEQVVFQQRTRLNFNTSFTGDDILITRLQAGNAQTFGDNGEATLTSQVFGDTGNTFGLDTLQYQFPVGDKLYFIVSGNAGIWDDQFNTLSPYFEDFDGGSGSLSAFAQRSPIYRIGGGAGLGVNYSFNDNVTFGVGYLAGEGADPSEGAGLFNGNYSAAAQLTYVSDDSRLGLGLTFVHAYFGEGEFAFDNAGFGNGFTGTFLANNGPKLDPSTTNSVGIQGYYQFNPKVALTGFFGYTNVNSTTDDDFDDADILYYALGLALPDLGREGSLGGLFFGAQPYVTEIDDDDFDSDIPFHLEAFYKYQINDFISITPGLIWQFNPNQDDDNDDVVIGTVRTTFVF
ncbi:MAG: iron uptake porin [Cyanobacteria bacterium P01_D01_bin.73]